MYGWCSSQRPQGIILHISPLVTGSSQAREAYLGWSGLAAASSLGLGGVGAGDRDVLETMEMDPEVGAALGLAEGTIVSFGFHITHLQGRSGSSRSVCAELTAGRDFDNT